MNRLNKTVKRIVALGVGTAMLGATLTGALAADVSDYPGAFLADDAFAGKIVIGEQAATSDLIGAIDIAASLQAASTTEVAVTQGTTTTVLEGDASKIGESSDMLTVGEFIGSVVQTLTEDDLEMLQSGRITTSKGSTEWEQTLEIDGGNAGDNKKVILGEDNDDEVGNFLFFDDGAQIFNYELEFTSGLESDVESNVAEDLEDESIFMLGQYYSIVDTDTSSGLTIELIAGDVVDTLTEGDTRTYTVDGQDYEVTVLVIGSSGSTDQVKFLVNGEVTDSMSDGDTDTLSDGLEIGVREIIETTAYREDDPGSVVEFYLGANKIEFDVSASGTAGSVEINRENIEDASVTITYTSTISSGDGDIRINRIEYALEADSNNGQDVYVPAGAGLREHLDEPEGMLNAEWDIYFAGLSEPEMHEIRFDPSGDDEYTLVFENRRGDRYSVPYLINDAGTASFGDEDDAFIFWERFLETGDSAGDRNVSATTFHITEDDYFVLTDDPGTNQGDSFILQWEDIDTDDQTITFSDIATGDNKEVQYTSVLQAADLLNFSESADTSGEITMGGQNFDFFLYNDSGTWNLAVDMDGDGDLAGAADDTTGDDVFESIDITVNGGGVLNLFTDADATDAPYTAGDLENGFNATLTTTDEDLDADGNDMTNVWTFSEVSTDVLDVDLYNGLTTVGYWNLEDINGEDRDIGMNGYGTRFEVTDESNEADTLTIFYPDEEIEALVYVVGGDVQSSSSTSGAATSTMVNRLPVGNIAVLDSDVSLGDEHLIVVGGPCVNTVAAELLGNPAQCAEGFQAGMGMIRAFDGDDVAALGDTMALLVAGYAADDTTATAQVVARAAEEAPAGFAGDSVEVVIAGADSVTLREATPMDDDSDVEAVVDTE